MSHKNFDVELERAISDVIQKFYPGRKFNLCDWTVTQNHDASIFLEIKGKSFVAHNHSVNHPPGLDLDYALDYAARARGLDSIPVNINVNIDSHAGHDVVDNFAGGKAFKYCRNCKVEV